MLDQIENVKNVVKSHRIEPFDVSELNVTRDLGGNERLSVSGRFNISPTNTTKLLNTIGIKENLKRKSFKDPEFKVHTNI